MNRQLQQKLSLFEFPIEDGENYTNTTTDADAAATAAVSGSPLPVHPSTTSATTTSATEVIPQPPVSPYKYESGKIFERSVDNITKSPAAAAAAALASQNQSQSFGQSPGPGQGQGPVPTTTALENQIFENDFFTRTERSIRRNKRRSLPNHIPTTYTNNSPPFELSILKKTKSLATDFCHLELDNFIPTCLDQTAELINDDNIDLNAVRIVSATTTDDTGTEPDVALFSGSSPSPPRSLSCSSTTSSSAIAAGVSPRLQGKRLSAIEQQLDNLFLDHHGHGHGHGRNNSSSHHNNSTVRSLQDDEERGTISRRLSSIYFSNNNNIKHTTTASQNVSNSEDNCITTVPFYSYYDLLQNDKYLECAFVDDNEDIELLPGDQQQQQPVAGSSDMLSATLAIPDSGDGYGESGSSTASANATITNVQTASKPTVATTRSPSSPYSSVSSTSSSNEQQRQAITGASISNNGGIYQDSANQKTPSDQEQEQEQDDYFGFNPDQTSNISPLLSSASISLSRNDSCINNNNNNTASQSFSFSPVTTTTSGHKSSTSELAPLLRACSMGDLLKSKSKELRNL